MPEQLTFDQFQRLAGETAIYPYRAETLNPDLRPKYDYERLSKDELISELLQRDDDLHEARMNLARAYVVLGLASEAGEVAGVLKKMLRDGTPLDEVAAKIFKENGDVKWYGGEIDTIFGISYAEAHQALIKHLADRKVRGVIKGSGDNR